MDEIDRLARQVARSPMDPDAISRLALAVEAATGRKVEVGIAASTSPKLAEQLVSVGMRLATWTSLRLGYDDVRVHTFYPDTIRGMWVDRERKGLRVNWSELAMHCRCAGADLIAWGAACSRDGSGALSVAAAWIDRKRGEAGLVEGVGTEVLPPDVERATRSWMGA